MSCYIDPFTNLPIMVMPLEFAAAFMRESGGFPVCQPAVPAESIWNESERPSASTM